MEVFTKADPAAPTGFFAVEAAGLAWLAEAEAAGGAPVARVVEVAHDRIVTEELPAGRATAAAAEVLGRALAATHAAGAPHHACPPAGWDGDGWIGALPMPHAHPAPGAEPPWGAAFAAFRLQPALRAAADAGALTPAAVADVEAVCSRLAEGAADDGRPPSRLHGDLWSGNVVWTPAGAVLVDPAAHGGHAETDLAMLALFGLPHLDRVLAAYDEAAPLAPGRREREPLHQLHPLLVHAALFGGAYGGAAARAAGAALAALGPRA